MFTRWDVQEKSLRKVLRTFDINDLNGSELKLDISCCKIYYSNLNTVMIYTEPRAEDLAARMEQAEG